MSGIAPRLGWLDRTFENPREARRQLCSSEEHGNFVRRREIMELLPQHIETNIRHHSERLQADGFLELFLYLDTMPDGVVDDLRRLIFDYFADSVPLKKLLKKPVLATRTLSPPRGPPPPRDPPPPGGRQLQHSDDRPRASLDAQDDAHPTTGAPPGSAVTQTQPLLPLVNDDGDEFCGELELKWTSQIRVRSKLLFWPKQQAPPNTTKISIYKTHQRFPQIARDKTYTFLAFRLDIGGEGEETRPRPPELKMQVTLQTLTKNPEVLEFTEVYPRPPTGFHGDGEITYANANSVTLTGGLAGHPPAPTFNLALGSTRTRTWSETYRVARTTFKNTPPRKQFEMAFSIPGQNQVPDTLAFAVLVRYPQANTRVPFVLGIKIKCDDVFHTCIATCDGATELDKGVDLKRLL